MTAHETENGKNSPSFVHLGGRFTCGKKKVTVDSAVRPRSQCAPPTPIKEFADKMLQVLTCCFGAVRLLRGPRHNMLISSELPCKRDIFVCKWGRWVEVNYSWRLPSVRLWVCGVCAATLVQNMWSLLMRILQWNCTWMLKVRCLSSHNPIFWTH